MFTKQQVLDILKEIDEDKTNTIDFFECLQVCEASGCILIGNRVAFFLTVIWTLNSRLFLGLGSFETEQKFTFAFFNTAE